MIPENNEEQRLQAIWQEAPHLEKLGQIADALALWREALRLKQMLITGAGDIGECQAIADRIARLESIS